jgi:hypothetical protein
VLINTGIVFSFLFLLVVREFPLLGGSLSLSSKPVEGFALPLEGVDHVEGGHGLAACVLSVGNCIADNVLEEHLEYTASLLVDEAADALDTPTTRKAADGGLGDALDVVAENLSVTLGAALTQTLTTLTTARHCNIGGGRMGGVKKGVVSSWREGGTLS